MNLLENLDQIILNLNLLINDVWKLVLFETSIQDNSFLVIIWSMVFTLLFYLFQFMFSK